MGFGNRLSGKRPGVNLAPLPVAGQGYSSACKRFRTLDAREG